ncbi:MAG TPA: hypothetical protein VF954_05435 [Acidimicrobiales bacterium]
MSRRHANLLRASAGWALWVWAVLIRNMVVDHTHSLGFRAVHVGLAVVSLGFAAATLWVASRGRRAARSGAAVNQSIGILQLREGPVARRPDPGPPGAGARTHLR